MWCGVSLVYWSGHIVQLPLVLPKDGLDSYRVFESWHVIGRLLKMVVTSIGSLSDFCAGFTHFCSVLISSCNSPKFSLYNSCPPLLLDLVHQDFWLILGHLWCYIVGMQKKYTSQYYSLIFELIKCPKWQKKVIENQAIQTAEGSHQKIGIWYIKIYNFQ